MDSALPQGSRAHPKDHPVMEEIMQAAVHQAELETQVDSSCPALGGDVDAMGSPTDEIFMENKQVLNHKLGYSVAMLVGR